MVSYDDMPKFKTEDEINKYFRGKATEIEMEQIRRESEAELRRDNRKEDVTKQYVEDKRLNDEKFQNSVKELDATLSSTQRVDATYTDQLIKIEDQYKKNYTKLDDERQRNNNRLSKSQQNTAKKIENLDRTIERSDRKIAELYTMLESSDQEAEIARLVSELEELNAEMYEDANAGITPNMNTAYKADQIEREIKILKQDSRATSRRNKDIENSIVSWEETRRQAVESRNALANNIFWAKDDYEIQEGRIRDRQNELTKEYEEKIALIKEKQESTRQLREEALANRKKLEEDYLKEDKRLEERRQDFLLTVDESFDDEQTFITDVYDKDIAENNRLWDEALDNLQKEIPVLNIRVKKYVSGPVSKNRDRIVALPLVVSIDYPEGENPREIPEEVLADLGIELFDMVGADYVTPNPSLMQITDSIPSAKDVYDYESSQYAQDFASNVVFFDYGVYLDYTRLPDGKHYAPPRE